MYLHSDAVTAEAIIMILQYCKRPENQSVPESLERFFFTQSHAQACELLRTSSFRPGMASQRP